MKKQLPLVSIIIVNYNGKHLIERCLSSVITTDYPNYEIIVVDNNSTDGSIAVISEKFPSCRLIPLDKNMGFAIANNIGAKNAMGDYIVFLNNDTFVTATWIRELVSVMEKDDSIVISQSLLLRPDGSIDSSGDFATKYGRTYNSKRIDNLNIRDILSARGAAMMARKDFFLSIGGFDDDYFISFEDVELGWKAWILGYRVVMVPHSIVYHDGGTTTSKLSALMTYHGLKNQLSLITTHYEKPIAIRNLLILLIQLSKSFLFLLLKISKGSESLTIDKRSAIKAAIWYMKNQPLIWKKHRLLNQKRRRSTAMLMKLGLITSNLRDQWE